MNRIDNLFQTKKKTIFSIYFTAGHPQPDSTMQILTSLQESGVDMVEVGMPFSDPLADGPVIQNSSSKALKGGMSISKLFDQLKDMRKTIHIPILLMGYINPVLQYGVEKFCQKCKEVGVDGVILPDLPMNEYQDHFQKTFDENDIRFTFLITPQTTNERILKIDSISKGFIYMVSSASTTGAQGTIVATQLEYFQKVKSLQLKNPTVIGFGISNKQTFERACENANGAIIGSAFVKMLDESSNLNDDISKFCKSIR